MEEFLHHHQIISPDHHPLSDCLEALEQHWQQRFIHSLLHRCRCILQSPLTDRLHCQVRDTFGVPRSEIDRMFGVIGLSDLSGRMKKGMKGEEMEIKEEEEEESIFTKQIISYSTVIVRLDDDGQ